MRASDWPMSTLRLARAASRPEVSSEVRMASRRVASSRLALPAGEGQWQHVWLG